MLVSDNNGYRVYCDTSEIMVSDKKYFNVRFYTEFDGAKNPKGSQTKFQMILSEKEYEAYRNGMKVYTV